MLCIAALVVGLSEVSSSSSVEPACDIAKLVLTLL